MMDRNDKCHINYFNFKQKTQDFKGIAVYSVNDNRGYFSLQSHNL
jgi:hypothetical protein